MADTQPPGGRIVVGIDGSDASTHALRWAVDQAKRTGASIDAVIAWHPVVVFGFEPPAGDFDVEGAARTVLTNTLHGVLDGNPPVEVRQHVVEGHAARALVDAARGADLLVVGNRGHTGFSEALLGSVGQYCVHHATCPVVVVRAQED
jgi:nucleotide-binding universal stress UspA family protein